MTLAEAPFHASPAVRRVLSLAGLTVALLAGLQASARSDYPWVVARKESTPPASTRSRNPRPTPPAKPWKPQPSRLEVPFNW